MRLTPNARDSLQIFVIVYLAPPLSHNYSCYGRPPRLQCAIMCVGAVDWHDICHPDILNHSPRARLHRGSSTSATLQLAHIFHAPFCRHRFKTNTFGDERIFMSTMTLEMMTRVVNCYQARARYFLEHIEFVCHQINHQCKQ